jgi:integrase
MPTIKISRRSVSSLPAPEGAAATYYDADLKGFGLRLMPSGARSWILEFRPGAGGRGVAKRRMKIGSAETLTPEEARESARKLLARVAMGEDPAGDRNGERASETLSDLLEAYLGEVVRTKRRPRTAVLFDGYVDNHIAPVLGARRANAVTRSDVVKLHLLVGEKHPVTANRLMTVLNAAFAFGVRSGRLPKDHANPVRGIEKFREQGRERYLSEKELARLGASLRLAETSGIPWEPSPDKKAKHAPKAVNRVVRIDRFAIAALRLLLFTGARLREILHLRWREVDLERGLLFLPDSKTGKKTIVLGAPAIKILTDLPRVGEFVIAGATAGRPAGKDSKPERPRSDLNRPWSRVSTHAGLSGLRLHDLRHSFASTGAGSGLGLQIVGKLLGHADGATTARYAHLADDPLKRASDTIAGKIEAALGGENG